MEDLHLQEQMEQQVQVAQLEQVVQRGQVVRLVLVVLQEIVFVCLDLIMILLLLPPKTQDTVNLD
jgi:hypothetical protein